MAFQWPQDPVAVINVRMSSGPSGAPLASLWFEDMSGSSNVSLVTDHEIVWNSYCSGVNVRQKTDKTLIEIKRKSNTLLVYLTHYDVPS
jgi:hypothetical protein